MDLKTYARTRGALPRLARQIGIRPAFLWQCVSGVRKLPPGRVPAVERATLGVLTAETLRPDVAWRRVADASWPHPGGRPLRDLA